MQEQVVHKVIVGIGRTGLSCARHFARNKVPFVVLDDAPSLSAEEALKKIAPDVQVFPIQLSAFKDGEEIVLSPGVPRSLAAIRDANLPITSDIAMFAGLVEAPMVAVTGSNGKSTVTALVGEMAKACGKKAGVGGNIGTPCLDLLELDAEVYVIEVSSYQLEVATQLDATVAVLLNLSPDHMDRYPDTDAYYRTKALVYRGCETAVVNRELGYEIELDAKRVISFGSDEPVASHDFGLRQVDGETFLCRGDEQLIATVELPIRGGHNHLNALAVLAIGSALDWDMSAMIEVLRKFKGLPHRCEYVATVDGVDYINDSKATNVEATLAAISGFADRVRRVHLLLGGQAKGASFANLVGPIANSVAAVYLYGKDRNLIARQIERAIDPHITGTLDEAVDMVRANAKAGDIVLFSPACASLDQFANYEARGDQFKQLVSRGGSIS